jgi:hypothetical protein
LKNGGIRSEVNKIIKFIYPVAHDNNCPMGHVKKEKENERARSRIVSKANGNA